MAQEGRDEKGKFTAGNKMNFNKGLGGRPSNVIDNMMLAVTCTCCGIPKNIVDFPPNKAKIGINTKCYSCTSKSYHPLQRNIRSRVHTSIRKYKGRKKATTIELLGMNILEYKEYLSERFTKKMNWGNYGTYWEIDHIIPLSHFDLDNESQQKQAFHYTNTQPMTVEDNRSKNNRVKYSQFKLMM